MIYLSSFNSQRTDRYILPHSPRCPDPGGLQKSMLQAHQKLNQYTLRRNRIWRVFYRDVFLGCFNLDDGVTKSNEAPFLSCWQRAKSIV